MNGNSLKGLKKILLIRFSSIGDIVLTSPVIRVVKNSFDGELHYLTKSAFSDILKSNPHVSKVHQLKDNWGDLVKTLKEEKYDLIIDLHHNLRSMRISRALKIPTIRFDKLNFQKWVKVNFKWDLLPDIHLIERYFNALKKIEIENDHKGLDFFIKGDNQVSVSSISKHLVPNEFIALAFGTAHYTKSIPESSLIKILEATDVTIALIGGQKEYELGNTIENQAPDRVVNLCGQLSISGSANIIQQSRLLLTTDTGMMHIGAALDKKIIVFWGNTIPKFGMFPYHRKFKSHVRYIQNSSIKCRPCSKIGKQSCPKVHFNCMQYDFSVQLSHAIKELS